MHHTVNTSHVQYLSLPLSSSYMKMGVAAERVRVEGEEEREAWEEKEKGEEGGG